KHAITVLRNDSLHIQGLNVIGIDDYWGRNFYPKVAMDKYHKDMANLVLCHNPDVCDLDIWGDYDGWILSGHTHGGQVRFPFQKATRLPVENKSYDEGLKHLTVMDDDFGAPHEIHKLLVDVFESGMTGKEFG